MSSYAEDVMDRFSGKGLLIDSNLLLLFVVGRYDLDIIRKQSFNRLASYTVDDFKLLLGLMSLFRRHVTTPHVLAEVSNWLGYLPGQRQVESLQRFAQLLPGFEELSFMSTEVAQHPRFAFLGLTDTAIAQVASTYLVLTDDARFIWHLNQIELEALNINHLRQELWLQA